MKKFLMGSSVLLVSFGVLVACNNGDNEDTASEAPDQEEQGESVDQNSTEPEENEENEAVSGDQTDEEDEEDEVDNDDSESDETGAMADGDFSDQLDLRIGDTGTVESTIGVYEVTLKGVEVTEEVNGQMSELDEFMIADFTIKNVGEDPISALDTISNFELTDAPEAAGMTDMAEYFDGVDAFEGEIAPGEEVDGQALYYTYDADEYYVLVTEGLVGTGAVKNQITFTFDKSEAE